MGWKWEEDDVAPNPNPRNINNNNSTENNSATRKIVKSSCKTEEVEPGRFVRKCDKTEQILRSSLGRPTEIVESKTEHTEDDVTDEVKSGKHSFESSGLEPYTFPGLRSDIESIERSLAGDFGNLIEAAEEMADELAKGFFKAFEFPSRNSRESPPFGRYLPHDRTQNEKTEEPVSAYSGLPGEVTDV